MTIKPAAILLLAAVLAAITASGAPKCLAPSLQL